MKAKAIKNSLIGIVLLSLVFIGCVKRPAPLIAEDFDSRRPLVVAVIPTAFLPVERGVKPHDPLSRPFIRRVVDTHTSENQVLRAFDEKVFEVLGEREIQIVDPKEVAEGLTWMKDQQSFNWRRFAQNLRADSLAFISLYSWRASVPLARRSPGDPYRYPGFSYDQFYWHGYHPLVYPDVNVILEISLVNAQKGDLLWRDRNYPPTIHSEGTTRKERIESVAEEAVLSAFKTFPVAKKEKEPEKASELSSY